MNMSRRALLIGIDEYDHSPKLTGCVADAKVLGELLSREEDGRPNFECQLLTGPGPVGRVTRVVLRQATEALFDFDGDILFFFSGHGCPTETGGYLVTQDGENGDWGLPMDALLTLSARSKAKSVFLIVDCCYSGEVGNPPNLQASPDVQQAQLREGVTILAASRPSQPAKEIGGHGVFTDLVLGALRGGAADVRGKVSAASIYGYVEAALGPWDQRPLYKTHASVLPPVRQCKAAVPDEVLRELPKIFAGPESAVPMDPSFEHSHSTANPKNVRLFNIFKTLRDARLLRTEAGDDLYFAALDSNAVLLTPLGQFYWKLAHKALI